MTNFAAPTARRRELQDALRAALAQGTSAIAQQVRYALMLSTMTQPNTAISAPESRMTLDHARLLALAEMAEALTDGQIAALVGKAQHITDTAVRLRVIARVALRIPAQHFHATVLNLYQQAAKVPDAAACAQLMFEIAPLLVLVHDEPAAPPALLSIVALTQAISNPEARIRSFITLSPYLPQHMRLRLLHRALDETDRLTSDAHRSHALHALAEHLTPELQERALRCAKAIKTPAEHARALTALARYLPLEIQPTLRVDALNAIASIVDEEERADALIAFAPHLEYITDTAHFPTVLEHALRIAVHMTRRAMRARMLVALAPHLTLDLQGEALAAVHTLSNERDRAMLLAELAPTLPPEMLVASLAVAHSMQAQDARARALTVLAHHLPDNARDQTILDALAAASNLPHPLERIAALIALMDILPPRLKEQALTQALESARTITNDHASSRAISVLAAHLPQNHLQHALDIALDIGSSEQRLTALMTLAPHLTNEREATLTELVHIISGLTFEYKRAQALADLIPLLPEHLLSDALRIAQALQEPSDQVSAYTAMVKRLSGEPQRELLGQCWRLIKQIDNGYDAASALATLAPLLPSSAARDLAQTAGMIIGSIMDEYDQVSAMTLLAPLLTAPAPPSSQPMAREAALEIGMRAAFNVQQRALRIRLLSEGAALWADIDDVERSFDLWRESLMQLANLPTADAVLCLSVLQPVIRKLGGSAALKAIAQLFDIR
jgi:hypothetical protein